MSGLTVRTAARLCLLVHDMFCSFKSASKADSISLLTEANHKLMVHDRPLRIDVYAGKNDPVVNLNSQQLMKIEHMPVRHLIETHRRRYVTAGVLVFTRARTHAHTVSSTQRVSRRRAAHHNRTDTSSPYSVSAGASTNIAGACTIIFSAVVITVISCSTRVSSLFVVFLMKELGIGITCKRCMPAAAISTQPDVVDALITIMLDSLDNVLI